ncbi:tetratricopeptide repeat protein [Deferribacter autotrophicus]|uniref:Tetratricopeptide repeat protein n=1 Tax=Deferribacter autotrophicus TaxID=500465 RepID=A0A5A8F1V6_9BACT|nr:tetratricopeptide repeat protein [Deferribacter autotrophicus]KAA0257295.1 tetratricopeptide repeat protein [Deferribacter autotrophicus]
MCKYLLSFFQFLFLLNFLITNGYAETKEIISEGIYNMGDMETPFFAERMALLNAKRNALEEAGTYIESFTKIENFKLTKDEIKILSSGIIKLEVLDKKRLVSNNGIQFWVKIKAVIETDELTDMINIIRANEKTFLENYKKLLQDYSKVLKELDNLKKQMSKTTDKQEMKMIQNQINKNRNRLLATQYYDEGFWYFLRNENFKAIDSLSKAINLDQNNSTYYEFRSRIYMTLGQFDNAIKDLNKVLELQPNKSEYYAIRGVLYSIQHQREKALSDFNIAILLDPENIEALVQRGIIYSEKKEYSNALSDFNKVIILNPNKANAYSLRGTIYQKLGNYQQALNDFNKAVELNPNELLVYDQRGLLFLEIKRYNDALKDFLTACQLGDSYGCKLLKNLNSKLNKK